MIGLPINRVDGPLKVTGRATYSYEEPGAGQPLYGAIVGATIGRGRIARIETTRAERSPGVRCVMTHHNAPPQHPPDLANADKYERPFPMLAGPEVTYHGMPVALVVATTFEQAQAAAGLVEVEYDAKPPGRYDLAALANAAFVPRRINAGFPVDSAVGDFDAGFASAPIQLDLHYTTPYELSQAMEPHSCLAVWSGDVVTIHASLQIVGSARICISKTLSIDPAKVKVISRYVGGGFGSKLGICAEAVLAVLAARELRHPVKVAMTRQQTFQLTGNRPASLQRIRLGADRDGRLIAFGHDVTMKVSAGTDYVEQTATSGRGLYAAPHRLTRHRGVELDVPTSGDVRAPGEAPGLAAIEAAMDELAHTLAIDPIELRIRNEPALHPELGVPFSDRRLVACMQEGARRFGWDRRPTAPASRREGAWMIGYGMAAAIRPQFQRATSVRVKLGADGIAVVQSDMTDIGTGTYTILAQVAAEGLGLPVERVRVELGEADFPESGGSGGSWGATNSTSALHRACRALRDKLLETVAGDARSPLHGLDSKGATFAGGRLAIGSASEELTEIVARNFPGGVEALGSIRNQRDEPSFSAYSLNTYGAHFAEVAVDADTGETRLRRMLGVFAVGRVLNAKTARSQLIGGMTWGVGAALLEEAVIDPRSGAFVNRDLAGYLLPVHADIPAIDAVVLEGFDEQANELGAKGLGELGICGSTAAVANAVFNATGIRVRDYPITLDKLLPGLPAMTGIS